MNDHLTQRLAAELGISAAAAASLSQAAEPLWNALAALGWVDTFGGMECTRVLPEAISFIHRTANQASTPAEWN